MKQHLSFRATPLLVAVFLSIFIQSCSKSSGSSDNNASGYYLNATVNGQAWAANVHSTLNNSTALAVVTNSGGTSVLLLLGLKAVNTDTSAVVLIFPQNITVNKAFAFNAAQYLEGAYVQEIAPGSGTYYGYNTTPATGGSGSITITLFDQSAKIIEGVFNGSFGSQQGRAAVQIADGKFRCPYTTDAGQLPKSGIKF